MDVETAMQGLPDVDWRKISAEIYREYWMCSGQKVRIEDPLLLHVSKSGGHYVINSQGRVTYIPCKWDSLTWLNKPGYPLCNFVSPRSDK